MDPRDVANFIYDSIEGSEVDPNTLDEYGFTAQQKSSITTAVRNKQWSGLTNQVDCTQVLNHLLTRASSGGTYIE